ncbi:MAG: Hsp70 family protein, partial [Clostridia bacterium]|nr:Hsp70 family protein [Clostridia bacterium]
VTITSSTNMSQEEIDKAVKDAEKFAEEDKKQKEAVEVKNRADSMVFQAEKTLNEIGDKVSDADKQPVKDAIEKLKATIATGNTEAIKADTEALEKAFYAISEQLYKQQGAQGQGFDPNAGADNQSGDGTYYNADYEDKTNE